MSKIILGDDQIADMVIKMSAGNPGALAAITDIINNAVLIYPGAPLGGVGVLLLLDTLEIYGPDIYVLWADKCGRETRKLLLLIRGTQLGLVPAGKLAELAKDHRRQLDLTEQEWLELDTAVCNDTSGFAPK